MTYGEGNKVPVGIYGKGSFFGEIELMMNTPRRFNIIAVTDCTMLILTKKRFNNIFYKKYPQLGISFEKIAMVRYNYLQSIIDRVNIYITQHQKQHQKSKNGLSLF